MLIYPEILTRKAFQPFGEVLETDGIKPALINEGHTEKFAGLANLLAEEEGRLAVHIYRSQPVQLPVSIRSMERHPLGSQAFYPLHGRPFPVLVAEAGAQPGLSAIRFFMTNGRQGFNLRAGTWHHYQLSLGCVSDYLVIDRVGAGINLEEIQLPEPLELAL